MLDIIPQLIINSVIAGSIYALLALGFNLIYGTVRFFDLGYGAIAAAGGYTVFFLSKSLGLDIYLSVILGTLFSGLIGYLIYNFIYRPLRRRKASNMVLLVASLGVITALQAVIAILFTSQFRSLSQSVSTQRVFDVFGGAITETQVTILVIGALVLFSLAFILKKTSFGKSVRAIGDDEEVAKIVGIHTSKIIGYVFFIGSAIAGLSGIMVGFDTGIQPAMGMSLLLKGVVASIIGGIGNVYGGVLGGFLLGFVENFGVWQISSEWKDAIAFVLLIVFLIFRPGGILKK